MLSILIPVYNFDVAPLVIKLLQQALLLNIPFEIIVCNDASTQTFTTEKLSNIKQIRYLVNEKNLHIAKTRNRLLRAANYKWVLFIDADVIPVFDNFLAIYWNTKNKGVFFSGGFTYDETKANNQSLRYIYGTKIEQHKHLRSCCNIFFNKENVNLFFDEDIVNYGFEDTLFYLELDKIGIPVIFIKNNVYHNFTDNNVTFLIKTESACKTLVQLITDKKITVNDTQLSKTYHLLTKFRLLFMLSLIQSVFITKIQKNLAGNTPKLYYFKWFKLLAYHRAMQQFLKK